MTTTTAAPNDSSERTHFLKRHLKRRMIGNQAQNEEILEFKRPSATQCPSAKNPRSTCVSSFRQPSSLMLLFLVFSFLFTCEAAGPYGTDNGYDNEGGEDPICWDSRVRWEGARETPNSTEMLDDNFDTMNGKLFASDTNTSDIAVKLRTSCYKGMNLTITPNIPDFDGRLMTGEAYSFRFELQFVPSQVNKTAFLAVNTNKTTWMRLLLCDAIRTGFCSPFIEEGDIEPSQKTDLKGPMINEETGKVDRYGYEEERTLMGVDDGLHLFTRFARWDLTEVNDGVYNAIVDVGFQVPLGKGGFYFFLGHAIVYFDVENNTSPYQFRIDIADAAPNNVVEFMEPPQINTITRQFKIGLTVVCCVIGVGEIYLLSAVLWYRKNQVLTLAQAPFLALLIVCGMIVTATVFVFMPTRDIYCNLRGVLILVPLTIMSSILIGRLWRVYSTLRIALTIGDQHSGKRKRDFGGQRLMDFLSGLASIHNVFKGEFNGERRNSLRQTVTDADLLRVIFIITLPQLILQVVGVSVYRRHVEVVFDLDSDVGRTICDRETRWPILVGEIYIGLLFVITVIVAYASRDLPSVFNEKNAIFMTASMNGLVLFFVLAMIFIFERSISEPNITSFLWIFMTLFLVVSTLCIIIIPKVRRAQSGEKIVMSKLLDPTQNRRQSSIAVRISNPSTPNGVLSSSVAAARLDGALSASEQTAIINNCVRFRNEIILNIDDPPPRRIERQLFALKDMITEFTNKSLEGRHISLSFWKTLISAVDSVQSDLHSIDFTWNEGLEELRDDASSDYSN